MEIELQNKDGSCKSALAVVAEILASKDFGLGITTSPAKNGDVLVGEFSDEEKAIYMAMDLFQKKGNEILKTLGSMSDRWLFGIMKKNAEALSNMLFSSINGRLGVTKKYRGLALRDGWKIVGVNGHSHGMESEGGFGGLLGAILGGRRLGRGGLEDLPGGIGIRVSVNGRPIFGGGRGRNYMPEGLGEFFDMMTGSHAGHDDETDEEGGFGDFLKMMAEEGEEHEHNCDECLSYEVCPLPFKKPRGNKKAEAEASEATIQPDGDAVENTGD